MRNELTSSGLIEWLAQVSSHRVILRRRPILLVTLNSVLLTAFACAQHPEGPAAKTAPNEKNAATSGVLDGVYRSEPTYVDVDPLHAYGREKYQLQELFVTFFSDGRFFESHPPYGLLGFNVDREIRRDSVGWGTYQFLGGRGRATFYRTPDEKSNAPLTFWGLQLHLDGSLVVTGDTRSEYTRDSGIPYTLLDRNDGLRLEGTFLRQDYKTFPRESRIPADSVTFTPDGRFVDKGLMDAASVMWPDASGRHMNFDDGVPGTGTYRIANYTLELRYSDGRVKPVFFYLEPRTPKSSVREIYVNTYKFVRVK